MTQKQQRAETNGPSDTPTRQPKVIHLLSAIVITSDSQRGRESLWSNPMTQKQQRAETNGPSDTPTRQPKRKRTTPSRAPRPALLESLSAVHAVNLEVRAHTARERELPSAPGRNLEGFHLTCDECHTSLSDMHFVCDLEQDCKAYCTNCPRRDECSTCGSQIVAKTNSRRADNSQLHAYAERAIRFQQTTTFSKARAEAEAAESRLQERSRAINAGSRKRNGYYETDIEDADIVVKLALQEGIPVVIRQAGEKFDFRPYEAQYLARVVDEQNAQAQEDEDVREVEVEAHSLDAQRHGGVMSVEDFFRPLIKQDTLGAVEDDPAQEHTTGYGLRDVGINPPQQSQAFFNGCDGLKLGSMIRPDGLSNLCSALPSFEQDPICGTSKPDLGPKLYITRPCLKTVAGRKTFQGQTFTHLHCDLADAANINVGKGSARWTVFSVESREGLSRELQKNGRNLFLTGSGALPWVTESWSKNSGLSSTVFDQHQGDLVIIPAGCAHQVENSADAYTVKAAQDFISVYSVQRCLQLRVELRALRIRDELQIGLTILHSAAASVSWLEEGGTAAKTTALSPSKKHKKIVSKPQPSTPTPIKAVMSQPENGDQSIGSTDSDLERRRGIMIEEKRAADQATSLSEATHSERVQALEIARQTVQQAEERVTESADELRACRESSEAKSQALHALKIVISARVEQARQTVSKLEALFTSVPGRD